ncbi:MAG: RNA pseudouridine synthase [Rickettsiales bacterium]|nr:RNA pseudouridine synthase [Rickettsiales bacterium]|tara:strand:- start:4133 stop:5125 length:993 start_codon:yes stop_codon:yes gene_type:complete
MDELSQKKTVVKKRLDQLVADQFPELSRTQGKKHILQGRVIVDEAVVTDPSLKVPEDAEIVCDIITAAPMDLTPVPMSLDVVYEDEYLIVLNKPAGLVVHPGAGTHEPTLVHGLLAHCQGQLSGIGGVERPGIVHRLDKETSGLMVVAKTDAAHQGLSAQFQDRTLKRRYQAFVYGQPWPIAGTIEGNIGRDSCNRQRMTVRQFGGKEAITHYTVLETYHLNTSDPFASLVECKLETGRTHQIRVHMLHQGHGVLGDTTYITRSHKRQILQRLLAEHPSLNWSEGRQALHAYWLELIHPITAKTMRFRVDLPTDLLELKQLLEQLSNEED